MKIKKENGWLESLRIMMGLQAIVLPLSLQFERKTKKPFQHKKWGKKNKKQIGGYMIDGTLSRHFLHPFNLKNHKELSE
jgi:hypothetical protein